MEYFYHDGRQEQGPLSLEELRRQPLQAETLVWHEGLKDWTVAIAIPELIDLFMDLSQAGQSPKAVPAGKPPGAPQVAPPVWTAKETPKEPVRPFPARKRYALPRPALVMIVMVALAALSLIGWGIYRSAHSDEATTTGTTNTATDTAAMAEQRRLEAERLRLKQEEERRQARLRSMRNNWSRYFRLEANDYDVVPLVGGILPFEVTVSNNADYAVDELTVRISYIKSGGKVYKTETVSFRNIPAHASRTKDAPGSTRGSSIVRKITHVRCSALNLCYPKGSGGKSSDPYYCD